MSPAGARALRGQMIVIGAALVVLALFADVNGIRPVLLYASVIAAAQPLVFAAIGEMVVERAGVLNLGVEGMMIVGAITGFATAVGTGSALLGVMAGALGGATLSLVFGVLTQIFLANQVATGLALTLFGLGFAALIGQSYTGQTPPPFPRVDLFLLSDAPVIGRLLFAHDLLVYLGIALVTVVWGWISFTRHGLILRAVGEDHDAAHALGYPVIAIRMAAIAFGGACAGIGGAYLSLVRVPLWSEGMTAGIGWIALAIVVFGAWAPWRVMLGAYLFGGVTILQLNMQAEGITALWLLTFALFLLAVQASVDAIIHGRGRIGLVVFLWAGTLAAGSVAVFAPITISSEYLSMAPYLATIIVLVVMASDTAQARLRAPGALGRVFRPRD
ncbi:MAG: ABC transporter permease [Pseudomonadota bacterium]